MVSLSVRYVGTNDVDVDFEGLYTTFEYMSKKAIREGGGKLKIKTRAEDMFELSWTGRSPVGETDYEEGWERYRPPYTKGCAMPTRQTDVTPACGKCKACGNR